MTIPYQSPLLLNNIPSTCRSTVFSPGISVDEPEDTCQPVVRVMLRKDGKQGFRSGTRFHHLSMKLDQHSSAYRLYPLFSIQIYPEIPVPQNINA